ncbi:hypothetical protein [Candidatus Enterovibrio escicola]|nr:hypothetical protein [Candidatus Enterovibrio escacola]
MELALIRTKITIANYATKSSKVGYIYTTCQARIKAEIVALAIHNVSVSV